MEKKEIKQKYQMRKEWKTDALFTVKALRSAYTAGHISGLSNLYNYVVGRGKMTQKEIKKFDELLDKISGSDIQDMLSKDIYEDDPIFKEKEKEYEINFIYRKVRKEWFEDDVYPENQFDLYVDEVIRNKYEDLNDKKMEDILTAVIKKCKQDDELKPYVKKSEMRDDRKAICPGE